MLFYKTYTEQLLPCLRRCRHLEWKGLYISCSIFSAGCILTYMAWKLGAPDVFLFLYAFLGTIGMLISCLSNMEVSKDLTEALPVVSEKQDEVDAIEKHKESIDKVRELFSEALISYNHPIIKEAALTDVGNNKQDVLPDEKVTETQTNIDGRSEDCLSCKEINYDPRVTLEQYVTAPSPGGGYSRTSDGNGEEQSRDYRLTPILGHFRTLPLTEPSAIFHVPLTEESHVQEEAACSSASENLSKFAAQSIKDTLTGNEAIHPYMSQNLQQPIYENLDQQSKYPFTERDRTQIFQKDNSSSKPVNSKDMSFQQLSSSIPVLFDKLNIYERLGPFTSSEGIYSNVLSSFEERLKSKQKQTDSHQFVNIPVTAQDSRPDGSLKFKTTLSSSAPFCYDRLESCNRLGLFTPSERIYVNVQPPSENVDGEQRVNHPFLITSCSSENCNLQNSFPQSKMETLFSSSVPEHYDRLTSYQRLKPLAVSENIYINVPTATNIHVEKKHQILRPEDLIQDLRTGHDRNLENQFETSQHETKSNKKEPPSQSLLHNSSQTENLSEISVASKSSHSKGIYMNLPNYLFEKETCRNKKMAININVDSYNDTKRDSSVTEEYTYAFKNLSSNNESNARKSISTNMNVSNFETPLKFNDENSPSTLKPRPEKFCTNVLENDTSVVPKPMSSRNQPENNYSPIINNMKNTIQENKKKTKSEVRFRASTPDSSTFSNNRKGMNLGEFLSSPNRFQNKPKPDHVNKAANSPNTKASVLKTKYTDISKSKFEFNNPLYGQNKEHSSNIKDKTKTLQTDD